MARLGFLIAGIGGALAVSIWTASGYAVPKYFLLTLGNLFLWSVILYRAIRYGKILHWPILSTPSILFLLIAGISTALSIDWSMSIFGGYRVYTQGIFPWISLGLLSFGIAYTEDELSDRFVVNSLAALVFISTIFAISQRLEFQIPYTPVLRWPDTDGTLMSSALFGHPVYFGSIIALLVPLFLREALDRDGFDRLKGWATLAALIICAYLTHKRGVVLGSFVGVGVYLVLAGKVLFTRRRAGFLGFSLLAAFLFFLPKIYGKGGDVARIGAWEVAAKTFVANPVIGSGPNTFLLSYRLLKTHETVLAIKSSRHVHFDAHNDILQIASTMGAFGVLGYLIFLIGLPIQWQISKKTQNIKFHSSLFGGLAGVFIIAKVNPIPIGTMILCAVFLGVIMRARRAPFIMLAHPRAGSFAAALAALIIFCFAIRGTVGDRYYLKGIKASKIDPLITAQNFNRASKWAPWELNYRVAQVKSLFSLPIKATPEMGLKIAATAVRIGEDCVKYHPQDPEAHRVLGLARLTYAKWAQTRQYEQGLKDLDRSEALAPVFRPYMAQRALIAAYTGDRKGYLRASKRVKDLTRFSDMGR